MRIAYIIGSNEAPRSVRSSARQDFLELLSDPHLRFAARPVDPEDGLLDELERALARRRDPGHALVVFSGNASIAGTDLALASGDHEASLRGIGQSLARATMAILLILDLRHEGPDDPFLAAEILGVAKEALDGTAVGLIVAASARESERKLPDAPLLHCLAAAVRKAKDDVETRSMDASTLYERMRGVEGFDLLSAVGSMPGPQAFPLLLPPNVIVSDGASIPPPPSSHGAAVSEFIANGNAHFDAGRHSDAIAEYKKRLLGLGHRDPERADVYFRIGRCKRALESVAEAAHNFDKALELDPMHAGALDAACDVLAEQQDFRRLEAMRRRHLDALTDPGARHQQLAAIAQAWLNAEKPAQALATIEQWANEDDARAPLDTLVRAQDMAGNPPARVSARKRLAERLEGVERASALVEAARIAQTELPGAKESVELCREALQAHPETLEALEIAATVLGTARRFDDLIEIYEFVVARSTDAELCWDLGKKLGMLHRDVRDDAAAALRCFTRAAEHRVDDVELLLWIGELHQAARDHEAAAAVLRSAARVQPQDADVVRRALWAFEKTGDDDSAWNAACILDHLGEADINESLNADAHQPDGLIAARSTLANVEFDTFAPERDAKLCRLLRSCARPALPLCFEELADNDQLLEFEKGSLQDAGSTTMIARSLSWTCRLMGIEPPPLYVVDNMLDGTRALALARPVAVADRSLGSGLELHELAFLWARALSALRAENGFLWACPSPQQLAKVVVAALVIGEAPGMEDLDGPARIFADALEEALEDDERKALTELAGDIPTRGARRRLALWLDETALLGGRVGLLLCGDARRAVDIVRRFPLNGIPLERQVDDLYQRALSDEHMQLRRTLGINVHA